MNKVLAAVVVSALGLAGCVAVPAYDAPYAYGPPPAVYAPPVVYPAPVVVRPAFSVGYYYGGPRRHHYR